MRYALRKMELKSDVVARAALEMALTETREKETELKKVLSGRGIRAAAVDVGGVFLNSIPVIMERAVVAAEREGIVTTSHVGSGVVAGAAHSAIGQISTAATGFNIGGKVGIARCGEHLCVAIFAAVGILNLDETCVGMAHRTLGLDD